MYKNFYSKNPKRVELLNAMSSSFWARFQIMLLNNILLSLCKITEKHKIAGRDTLTIQTIFLYAAEQKWPILLNLASINEKIKISCARMIIRRNNLIAHRNLEYAMNRGVGILPVNYNEIEESIKLCQEFLGTCHEYLNNSSYSFRLIGYDYGDGVLSDLADSYHFNNDLFINPMDLFAEKEKLKFKRSEIA